MSQGELRLEIEEMKARGGNSRVIFELEGLLSGEDGAVVEVADLNSYAAYTLWTKEDLESALGDAGVDPTEENVETLLEEVEEDLQDCSQGWLFIQDAVAQLFHKEGVA